MITPTATTLRMLDSNKLSSEQIININKYKIVYVIICKCGLNREWRDRKKTAWPGIIIHVMQKNPFKIIFASDRGNITIRQHGTYKLGFDGVYIRLLFKGTHRCDLIRAGLKPFPSEKNEGKRNRLPLTIRTNFTTPARSIRFVEDAPPPELTLTARIIKSSQARPPFSPEKASSETVG
jgi:hypothetical protein